MNPLLQLLLSRAAEQMPATPQAPDVLPRPFKSGDHVLHQDDIVASTNYGPWSHSTPGMERGITRREDRDAWIGPQEYQAQANLDASSDPVEQELLRAMLHKAMNNRGNYPKSKPVGQK